MESEEKESLRIEREKVLFVKCSSEKKESLRIEEKESFEN